MFRVIKAGHIYEIQNRCEKGFLVDSWQTITIMETKNDNVESVGIFRQDLLEAFIHASEWATENSPYPDSDIERNRKNSIACAKESLGHWSKFTEERLADGAKLLGHVK